ncbi:hypothetical protein QBC38DRAFT_151404 [Podospora fimiseda]|uniref:BHLH domain-containing protein n=1 Tax=Podospora fimiseda TaxID=252190 RepID=A0AAN7GWP8_9PEZI|nr:hypothetical protein QBC38DRAFT_151404 [Podospora fimiseda]
MDASTPTTGFHPNGLSAEVDKNILSPVDPAFDFLDHAGICAGVGPNAVPWCPTNQAYPPSPYLDETSSEYFPRPSYPDYPNLNWPATGNLSTISSLSAPHGLLDSGPGGSLVSPISLWPNEIDCKHEVFSPIGEPGFGNNQMMASPPASVESPPNSSAYPQKGRKATKLGRIAKQHNVQLRTASRKSRKTSSTSSKPISPPSPTDSQGTSAAQPSPPADDDDEDDLTPEERRARRNHNLVEKQYRNRLNAQFERLLAVLPLDHYRGSSEHGEHGCNTLASSILDEKRMSKAEVLDLAVRRIRMLEAEKERMQRDRSEMIRRIDLMSGVVQQPQPQIGPLGL